MDFFVNGCAGAWANGCRFHYLPWSRTTSDLSDFSVLIFDLVYSLQFCMWMGCLFYLAALRIIGGIMADVNELHSGEMHLFGSDELDRDSQVGHHENETFGSNSPCKYPENWTPCSPSDPGDVFAGSAEAVKGASASTSSERWDEKRSPVVPASQQDALFARCLLSNCDFSGIKMPWEVGIFKDIFEDGPPFQQLVPSMEISSDCSFPFGVEPQLVAEKVADVAKTTSSCPVFSTCVSSADGELYEERRANLREAAIGKLLIVLRHCLLASVTGRHIIALGSVELQAAGARDIVDAVVGVRSPATLVKRANSLLSFLRWVAKFCSDVVNPFEEETLWKYFQFMREVGAPATRADSTLSALRFAHYVLGFDSLAGAVTSRRLIGISEIMLAGKRLLKQSAVLTVAQVRGLHTALVNKNLHIMDRAVVGAILIGLYGRCRNSDLQSIHSFEADFGPNGGFITIETCNHKAGRLAALKTRLLPILIPARGVTGDVWAKDVLQVFNEAGVNLTNPINGPLLPAPAGDAGVFMKRGLRSTEVSALLRRFVGADEPGSAVEVPVVSSHSLKATTLSWAARFGLSPEVRSLLGRHSSCLNETFAVYSIDLLVGPVAELQRVIDVIANGEFFPDLQRSCFFRTTAHSQDVGLPLSENSGLGAGESSDKCLVKTEAQHNVAAPDAVSIASSPDGNAMEPEKDVEDAGSSDSSTDDSEQMSSDDSDTAEPPPKVKRFRARIPTDEKWYVHSRSHLIHRYDGDCHNDIRFLVCGKRLNDSYKLCTEASAWNVLCKSCNRR